MRRLIGMLVALCAAPLVAGGCGGGDSQDTTSTPPTSSTTTVAETPASPTPREPPVLTPVVEGLTDPVQTIVLPNGVLWVAERGGRIWRVSDGELASSPVADLSDSTLPGGEQGLLSVTLHPNFPATDLAYVHRTDLDGSTLVTEHRVDAGYLTRGPTRTLLRLAQPYSNHNGGSLAFGPDGLLYLGLGDGGAGGDPDGNGQNTDTLLGSLIRTEIGGRPDWQVAAYGLRNPWRFSFDPLTGHGWIGDVGQNLWEEVDVFPNDSDLVNFGWSVREGPDPYQGGSSEFRGDGAVRPPVASYSHSDGCSITGGVVVRSATLPALDGRYLYADYCSAIFWSLDATRRGEPRREEFTVTAPVSIDAGPSGRVYVTSIAGAVYRLEQPPRGDPGS